MHQRIVRPVTLAVLAAAALSSTGAAAAAAPAPTCGGKAVTVRGTDRPETLRGTAGPDVIDARGGHDRVFGAGGDDVVCAGSGHDLVDAGAGHDRVLGGQGHDRLLGAAGRDDLDGGAGNDRLDGGAGADALRGGAGADRLSGGGEADRLDGGVGSDVLGGGAGDDRLDGGRGGARDRDTLTSGAGADTVVTRPGDRFVDRRAGDVVLAVPTRAGQPSTPAPAPAPAPAPVVPPFVPSVPGDAPAVPPTVPVDRPVDPPVDAPSDPVTSGRVSGTVTGPTGPAAGIVVRLLDLHENAVARTLSDDAGRYSVAVPAGAYVVQFEDEAGDLVDVFSGGATAFYLAAPVDVAARATLTQDVQLAHGYPLSGRVVDVEGAPVAGLTVYAYTAGASEDGFTTSTGVDGSWSLRGVPSGTYEVRTYSDQLNFLPARYVAPGEAPSVTASPVVVDQARRDLDIVVRAGLVATGRVLDPSGQPLAGVSVSAWAQLAEDTFANAWAQTGSDGTYRLVGLVAGTWSARLHAPGFLFTESAPFVVGDQGAQVPDITMSAGTTITGRVVSDGTEVAGAWVHDTSSHQSATIGADGTFTLAGLPFGAHTLVVKDMFGRIGTEHFGGQDSPDEALLTDTTQGSVSGVEIRVTAGRTVSGTVTVAGGAALASGWVEVAGANGEVYSTASVKDGAYVARGVPQGSLVVSVPSSYDRSGLRPYALEYHGGVHSSADATRLPAGSEPLVGVDVELDPVRATTVEVYGPLSLPVGEAVQLGASVRDQAGEWMSPEVTWSVAGAGATIGADGTLVATEVGTVVVTARAGDASATWQVDAYAPVVGGGGLG